MATRLGYVLRMDRAVVVATLTDMIATLDQGCEECDERRAGYMDVLAALDEIPDTLEVKNAELRWLLAEAIAWIVQGRNELVVARMLVETMESRAKDRGLIAQGETH